MLGRQRRDRRVQGRRGLPAPGRRRRARRCRCSPRTPLRFVGALTFSALASEPARTSLFDAPEPDPAHPPRARRADLVIVAPGHRQAARQVRRPASPTTCSPPRCSRPGRPVAGRARRCTPRCGSTRRCRRTWPRCAAGACTWSTPSRAASPAATSARAASPIPRAIVGRGRGGARPRPGDLAGVRVLVTAGGTREPIDAVRFIGNRSSGKQGYAVAAEAAARGAPTVTLVTTIGRPVPRRRRGRARSQTAAGDAGRGAGPGRRRRRRRAWPPRSPTSGPRRPPTGKLKKARGRPRDRARADARHPRRPRARPSGRARCSSASRPRPTTCAANAADKLRAQARSTSSSANDVSQPDAGFEVDTNRAILLDAARRDRGRRPLLAKLRVGRADPRRESPRLLGGAATDPHRPTGACVEQLHLHVGVGHRGPPRQDVRPDLRRGARRDLRARTRTSRVACETLCTTGLVVVAGEITTQAYVDIPARRARHRPRHRLRPRVATASTATPAASSPRSTSSRPTSRRASTRREEIRDGAARPLRRGRRRRPGDDVRLRLRRDRRPHADADLARAPARRAASPRSARTARSPYLRPDGKTQVTHRLRGRQADARCRRC